MKSFLKVFSVVTLFSASGSAFAIGSYDCSPDLVIKKDISQKQRLTVHEMIKTISRDSAYEQFGDFVLIKDTMSFSRRARYLHATKIFTFERVAETSLSEFDPKYAKGPFVFSFAGETFYLATAKQFKDFENVTEQFIKSIAGLPLPELPDTPSQNTGNVVRFKVPRLTQNEWIVKKKFEKYFAPEPSRLGPNKPMLIITWWNRPGWAVVDSEYLKRQGAAHIRNMINTEVQVTLADSVYDHLFQYVENSPDHSVLPASKLSSLGTARMNDLLVSQNILVTEESSSGHRLVIIPLMTQELPKSSPETKVATPVQPPVKAVPPAPIVKPPALTPAPTETWASEIYDADAPPIGHVNYYFLPLLKPENFIKDFKEFERQLELNIPLALPSRARHGLYELPFFWSENHEIKVARLTFSFTRYQNGDVRITISEISMMDDFAEKSFYQQFADFHRLKDKEFTLARTIRAGSVSSSRLFIHRNIRSKLLLKHDLNLAEQAKIIEAMSNVAKNGRGYRARITYEGLVYSVYVEADDQGRIIVKSIYINEHD